MEKICGPNVGDLLLQDFVLVEIIQLLDLQTLIRLKLLNKVTKEAIERENYTMLQKIREFLNIPTTFDANDILSTKDVTEVFKYVLEAVKSEPVAITPFAFFTDGGVDNNTNYYFLQNVWKKTGI